MSSNHFFFVSFVCPNRIPRCQYQSTAVDANDLFTAKKPTATKFLQLNALTLSKYLASSFWEHGIVFLRNLRILAIIYKPVTSLTTPHTYIFIVCRQSLFSRYCINFFVLSLCNHMMYLHSDHSKKSRKMKILCGAAISFYFQFIELI